MTMQNAAIIDVNSDGNDYVYNVGVFAEEDYEYLQSIWPIYTGMRIQWISDLEPAAAYVKPVWLQWVSQPDGWYPPVEDRASEEDAN